MSGFNMPPGVAPGDIEGNDMYVTFHLTVVRCSDGEKYKDLAVGGDATTTLQAAHELVEALEDAGFDVMQTAMILETPR
jgi:hypothetical protein